MSDKKIELIQQLLAKAESTTPEEAEALTAAAEKMMVKLGIDRAMLAAKKKDTKDGIITVHRDYRGAYAGEMFKIGQLVSQALGLSCLQSWPKGIFRLHIIGFQSDVAEAQQLIASLEVQAAVALKVWWKAHRSEYMHDTKYEQGIARQSFVEGFANGAARRLRENRATLIEEAGAGTELALIDRSALVKAAADAMTSGKGRSRGSSLGGSAYGHGRTAGENARTGEKVLN